MTVQAALLLRKQMDIVLLFKALILGIVEGLTEFFANFQHRTFNRF